MRLFISTLSLIVVSVGCSSSPASQPAALRRVPVSELGTGWSNKSPKVQLIGRLGVSIGELCTIQGELIEGPFKGYEGGPNLRVQRINGQPVQEEIQIPLRPYFLDWGKQDGKMVLPKIEQGKTYELHGYSDGGFVGIPGEAGEEAGIILQTTGHYFREYFKVIRGKEIPPVVFTPADFAGREAMLEGTAVSKDGHAFIQGEGWMLRVAEAGGWEPFIEKKRIHAVGRIAKDPKGSDFTVPKDACHLSRLEDQLGRHVILRGRARSLNGVWWFHCRDTDLYVEGIEKLPNWTGDSHWRPMVIRGVLAKEMLPDLGQISLKDDRDLKPYFIVKDASWEPLDHLLAPEEDAAP